MDLADITPLILTFNEEANLDRTLRRLAWAREVVVLDSFSSDRTIEICADHANVRLVQRAFDSGAGQTDAGLRELRTDWVLSLDADYVVSEELLRAIREARPTPEVTGYSVDFRYAVFGRLLRGTLYPPREVLFRVAGARHVDDGHTPRVRTPGRTERLTGVIVHDDRKGLDRWFASQWRYATLEVAKLEETPVAGLGFPDRLRRWIFPAPWAVLALTLFGKGLVFDGWPGWYYAMQRFIAELILSLILLDRRVRR